MYLQHNKPWNGHGKNLKNFKETGNTYEEYRFGKDVNGLNIVNAILSSKISIAQKNAINVACKATVPPDLKISDVHLCAVIGNLLDNAIEACEKVPVQNRFIRVYIGIFKQQLYISVTNSTETTRRKKLTELITTKKGEHGLGLRRVDKIVSQYEGYVNRKNEPGVFATEIMLGM